MKSDSRTSLPERKCQSLTKTLGADVRVMHENSQELVDVNPTNEAFIQECRNVFTIFDCDGKGTITQYKLSKVMKAFGWRAEHKELQVSKFFDRMNIFIYR